MMNKVLELIEAFKLFPFDPNKYEIVIHPQSLIHLLLFFLKMDKENFFIMKQI